MIGDITQLSYQLPDLRKPVFGRNILVACRLCTQATKHCFGIQIITFFHYLIHYCLHRSIIVCHSHRNTIFLELAERVVRQTADAFCPQTFQKRVHEEILRRININCTDAPAIHIPRHRYVVTVLQPVTGYPKRSGRSSTAFCNISQRIIRRSRSTFQPRRISLHAGRSSYRNHSFIKHQRRQIGLEGIGRIVPQPTASPIQGVFHGNITVDLALYHRERQAYHPTDQRIQRLIIKLRIESSDNVYIPLQRITFNHSLIPDLRTERLIRLRTCKRRNRSQQLHCGGRAGKLVRLIIIQGFIGSQVVHRNGYIRAFGQLILYQRIQLRRKDVCFGRYSLCKRYTRNQ